jgi:hypothetical protein
MVFTKLIYLYFGRMIKKNREKNTKNMAQPGASILNTDFNFDGGACQRATHTLKECMSLAKKFVQQFPIPNC